MRSIYIAMLLKSATDLKVDPRKLKSSYSVHMFSLKSLKGEYHDFTYGSYVYVQLVIAISVCAQHTIMYSSILFPL